MKIDIQDLFDSWEEQELNLQLKRRISPSSIMRRTMGKIQKTPHRWKAVRKLSLAAAACLLLAGSAFAVAQYRASRLEKVDGYMASSQGAPYKVETDTVMTFVPEENDRETAEAGHVLALRATYLPDPLVPIDCITLRTWLEHLGEETGEELLTEYPLEEELLDTAYTHICTLKSPDEDSSDHRMINITAFSAGQVEDKNFVTVGTNLNYQEGMLCGMEATWLTQAFGDEIQYSIVLYDETRNCVIYIGGSSEQGNMSFDLLEQIAEGLEIIDTGIPSTDLEPEWDWNMMSTARG